MTQTTTCMECGERFSPSWTYRACPACGRWAPRATNAQLWKFRALSTVLGLAVDDDAHACWSPQDAAEAIDRLLVLAELDPDVVECAVDGCDLLVNRTRPIAHTYCSRHRELRDGKRRPAVESRESV